MYLRIQIRGPANTDPHTLYWFELVLEMRIRISMKCGSAKWNTDPYNQIQNHWKKSWVQRMRTKFGRSTNFLHGPAKKLTSRHLPQVMSKEMPADQTASIVAAACSNVTCLYLLVQWTALFFIRALFSLQTLIYIRSHMTYNLLSYSV